MRSSCKILQTEFKAKLRKIINNFPSQSIRLKQFMQLMTTNNIKMYSKAQVGKLTKIFDNPLKLCRIEVPLSHLILDCVQESDSYKYFIVRISPISIHIGLYQVKNVSQGHNIDKCLHAFVRMLRRMYGNDKNWFKVLGGFTIAITIDVQIFRRNIMKLLNNTAHAGCIDAIINIFLNECPSKNIQWKVFMKIVGEVEDQFKSDKLTKTQLNTNSKQKQKETIQTTDYRFSSLQRIDNRKNRQMSPVFSTRNKLKQSRTLKTEGSINFDDLYQNYNEPLTLSSKRCILYEKKSNTNQNLFFSTNKSAKYTKYSKTNNRKWNTTSHFYTTATKTQLSQKSNRYKESIKTQIKPNQSILNISTNSKSQIDYVVVLQKECGAQIQI